MAESTNNSSAGRKGLSVRLGKAWEPFTKVPLLGWLLGILVAVTLEQLVGAPLAHLLGLAKVPVLFGFVIVLKQPSLLPGTLLYILLIYLLPVGLVARLG
ncbi:MAG: hypothetical protein H8D37_05250, partial [Chloroflexi bacterium]|nr:hypothetical protein [Chloroflexota bacterium]